MNEDQPKLKTRGAFLHHIQVTLFKSHQKCRIDLDVVKWDFSVIFKQRTKGSFLLFWHGKNVEKITGCLHVLEMCQKCLMKCLGGTFSYFFHSVIQLSVQKFQFWKANPFPELSCCKMSKLEKSFLTLRSTAHMKTTCINYEGKSQNVLIN